MQTHRLTAFHRLWRRRRADRQEIERFRDAQLRRLVRHAYAHVAYYRELFDRHRITPEAIRTVADLGMIPITTRRDLQIRSSRDLVARTVDPARLITRRTSGSSGQPLSILRTWLEERLLGAFRWQALHSLGMQITDRHAEIEEVAATDPRDHSLLHRISQSVGVYRQARIHALQTPPDILEAMVRFRPDVITGYAGVLARVARTTNPDAHTLRPRFIAAHSDVLMPHMRRQIATAFAAPVYEIYDSNEFNVIAWECVDAHELHTCDDSSIVEVIVDGRRARPGERGEVVITGLHSFAMPFIRYRQGDVVTQGAPVCDCGQPFGTIRAVQGRMFDYFPLPDGRLVHPYEIIAILGRAAPWIREFELIQEQEHVITLRAVPQCAGVPSDTTAVRDAVAGLLGAAVTFRVDLVADMPVAPGSKLRACRSLVASDYDGVDVAH